MNPLQQKITATIEKSFLDAINKLKNTATPRTISDLYIAFNDNENELLLYNDNEEIIDKVNTEDSNTSSQNIANILKHTFSKLQKNKTFDNEIFDYPFSISLVDNDFSIIEELIFIDDEMLRLDDPLLKDLDKDLEQFLKQLMS